MGAGDSVPAAYIASRLGGKDAAEAHRIAVKVSAYVCACNGAINPLPADLTEN